MLGKNGGGLLLLFFSVGLLISLSILFYLSLNPENELNKFEELFGKNNEEIYGIVYNAEFNLARSDQEIRNAVFITTNEFGENGGYSKENFCSKKEEYVVIDFEDCNPDLKANYIEVFNRYIKAEGLKIEENKIIGSLDNLEYEKELISTTVKYKIENKFKQDVLLDLDFLSEILERIKDCKDRNQDLSGCTGIQPEMREGYAFFTIENDKNGLMILEDKAIVKKPTFKFAVKND